MKPCTLNSLLNFGLVAGALVTGGLLYLNYQEYQRRLTRCEDILQESAITDRFFCKRSCERDRLVELVEQYKLEDGVLAYSLTTNRCGE